MTFSEKKKSQPPPGNETKVRSATHEKKALRSSYQNFHAPRQVERSETHTREDVHLRIYTYTRQACRNRRKKNRHRPIDAMLTHTQSRYTRVGTRVRTSIYVWARARAISAIICQRRNRYRTVINSRPSKNQWTAHKQRAFASLPPCTRSQARVCIPPIRRLYTQTHMRADLWVVAVAAVAAALAHFPICNCDSRF